MVNIRGWTNFILIPYFYPEGRWQKCQRPFDSGRSDPEVRKLQIRRTG